MKHAERIQKMSLAEKAAMLQGWAFWTSLARPKLDIPEMFMADGPHGLRKQLGKGDHIGLNTSVPATCFPTAATIANSWDVKLGETLGQALGAEAAANDVHVLLGPGINMKRSPLCGRNFEYFSEDPYLAGKMAAAYIRGIQRNGVSACPKHFAANSQELRRMASDSVVDERTLREIYLTAFEIAVREANPHAIMSAYNMINGTYCNENGHLLTEILREEWGFDGAVITDWGADNNHTEGVRNGSNLVMPMPGPDEAMELVEAVRTGKLPENVLDQRVDELLELILRTYEAVEKTEKTFDFQAHHDLAYRCAAESVVLLDNDGILPLGENAKVAVIGEFAQQPRYQGAGSSMVNPTRLDNLLDCLRERGVAVTGYARGFDRKNPMAIPTLIREAEDLAKGAETVLLCIGLDEIMESEGMDRMQMELSQSQRTLIEAVCKVNRNVVLVLSGGAPFVMPDRNLYRAAIHGYLSGQAGAGAMADALLGKVNPSGKLNETWPEKLGDTPCFYYYPGAGRTAEYREGIFIGYRYYDTANVPVRYPFGHGLSYTQFAYSNLEADEGSVTFTVTNAGDRDGAEIAQIYISCVNGKLFRPRKELKGFAKVFLKAGESKTVTVDLDDKAFRYFNVTTNEWEIETADYEICVAASAADVRLRAVVAVKGTEAPLPYGSLPSYESANVQKVSDEEFSALLGRPLVIGDWGEELQRNDTLSQMYYARSAPARLVFRMMKRRVDRSIAKGFPDLNVLFVYNMPFRAIGKMSGDLVSEQMVDDLVYLVNGHFFVGAGRFIRDFFRNLRNGRHFKKELKS